MDDLKEKAIKGIECCLHVKDCNCGNCPYDDIDLRCKSVNLYNDIMKLLKEQEPRVMTLEEIKSKKDHPVWIENAEKYYANKGFWAIIKWVEDNEVACISTDGIIYIEFNEYGDTRRFWTSRPTNKQKKAVKWE